MLKHRKHTTIKEVADLAGVSIQTVSRVLNDRPDVSPATRQRVQQIINELGYQPYALARGLASRQNRTLGLFASNLSDPFFAAAIAGANAEALANAYLFMLGSVELRGEDESQYQHILAERRLAGMLFIRSGRVDDHAHLQQLYNAGVPVVTTGFSQNDAAGQIEFTLVDVKNVEGGRKATRYLIDLGHRQIAMIEGPCAAKSTHDRSRGYCLAMHEAGIAPVPGLIAGGDWTHASGYAAMKQILAAGQPCSALFSHHDRMAIGAIAAIRQSGLRVPQDVSVIGYDDVPEAAFADPPLTTIRQPSYEVGRMAAHLLIQRVENPRLGPTQVLLDTELVLRASCSRR